MIRAANLPNWEAPRLFTGHGTTSRISSIRCESGDAAITTGDAMNAPENPAPDQLIGNPEGTYGARFHDHLLEQYKLYVESAQKVSEKRITTGNYLLTVNSSLLTVFGIATGQHIGGAWLA